MLGWQPLVTSWLHTLPATFTEAHKELISSLYHRMVPPCLDFVRKAGFKVQNLKTCLQLQLLNSVASTVADRNGLSPI